jgi:hypothetical protein
MASMPEFTLRGSISLFSPFESLSIGEKALVACPCCGRTYESAPLDRKMVAAQEGAGEAVPAEGER